MKTILIFTLSVFLFQIHDIPASRCEFCLLLVFKLNFQRYFKLPMHSIFITPRSHRPAFLPPIAADFWTRTTRVRSPVPNLGALAPPGPTCCQLQSGFRSPHSCQFYCTSRGRWRLSHYETTEHKATVKCDAGQGCFRATSKRMSLAYATTKSPISPSLIYQVPLENKLQKYYNFICQSFR